MRLLPLFLTVFIDSLGFGLVFPIFSPLIVGNEGGMFADTSSLAVRGLLFGFLVSAYCIGQFFGGPLLGSLSDRKGRKKVLIGAMWIAFFSYLLAGLGVIISSLSLLYLGRILTGISAGSLPVAQSVIADVSTKETKAKNFALVGTSFWLGFVIGPYIGGKLAIYGFTLPFSVAAFVCLFNALLLLFVMHETVDTFAIQEKVEWLRGIKQIRKAFTLPHLRGFFLSMFVFCLGWGFFTEFSPIFLTRHLHFSLGEIANFYAWIGLWIAICQGIVIRPVLKHYSPDKLFSIGLLSLGFLFPIMLKLQTMKALMWFIPLIALCQAFIFPSAAILVSNLSSRQEQGEMLGINNSVQWAAIAIPPLFSGSFVALFPHLPISLGSICTLVAFVVFMKVFRKAPQKGSGE